MRALAGHLHIVQVVDFVPTSSTEAGPDELYMEFCEVDVGDEKIHALYEVMTLYNSAGKHVPEMFAWDLFIAQLKVLCFMRFGIRDVMVDQPVEGWIPIFHKDINAGNILLSSTSTSASSEHPRMLLGDFGLAVTKAEFDEEILEGDDRDYEDIGPPRDMDDVWGVIGIMLDICHNRSDDAPFGGYVFWHISEELGGNGWKGVYSEEFRAMLKPLNSLKGMMKPGLLQYAKDVV